LLRGVDDIISCVYAFILFFWTRTFGVDRWRFWYLVLGLGMGNA